MSPDVPVGIIRVKAVNEDSERKGAIKAMGARRWQKLHRAVYLIALLALLHFFWMRSGKQDFAEVGWYALVVAALLGWRLWRRWAPSGAAQGN